MMMGGSSHDPGPQKVSVISPQFCVNDSVNLTIVRKLMNLLEGNLGVTDVNGNIMFRVKSKLFSFSGRQVLYDLAGNTLITFQPKKFISPHRRWVVFRGESTDSKDLLFSVKISSLLQMKTKLDVFLASNPGEELCDFRIEGSWFERSCVIYAGNSSNIIAQMHRKQGLWKDTLVVTVYPNVDYAFIAVLVVILGEINRSGATASSVS